MLHGSKMAGKQNAVVYDEIGFTSVKMVLTVVILDRIKVLKLVFINFLRIIKFGSSGSTD